MLNRNQKAIDVLKIFNILFLFISIFICSMLMMADIPGIELLETNPNWLLIWLVSWSIKRTAWQGAIAGLVLGWIYDGITASSPSHIFSFILVGILSSSLQKQKYTGEDFISVAFIVFFMSVFAETVFAWQYAREYFIPLAKVITKYKQIVVISGVVTSLWSPVFYYPFNLWYQRVKLLKRKAR